MGEGQSPSHSGFQWEAYIAILVAVGSTGIVALVLLGVSHGSPETAYELLRSLGTGSVALGVAIRTLPALLTGLVTTGLPFVRRRVIRLPSRWVIAFVVVPIALATPTTVLVALTVIAPGLWWVYSVGPNDRIPSARTQRVAGALLPFLLVLGLCSYLFLRDDIWLPREVVELRSGDVVDALGPVLTQ